MSLMGHNGGPRSMAAILPQEPGQPKGEYATYKRMRRLYSNEAAPPWIERKLMEMARCECRYRDALAEMGSLEAGSQERSRMTVEAKFFRDSYEKLEAQVRAAVSPEVKLGKREGQALEAERIDDETEEALEKMRKATGVSDG